MRMKKIILKTAKILLPVLIVMSMLISAATVNAASKKAPKKVKITSVRAYGNNRVAIKWKKVSNATQYRIYYKKSGSKKWKPIANVSSKKTSYIHKSSKKFPLVNGKKYVYTVRAYNKYG